MPSPLRDAILDSVDERDEMVRAVADRGVRFMRQVIAQAVVTAAKRGATAEEVRALLQRNRRYATIAHLLASGAADRQAEKDAAALRKAGKGPDEGPVRKRDVEERRARKRSGPSGTR